MNNRLINTKVAGGGGCTDIVDNYDPFGGNGVALYQLNGNANDVSGNYNGTASSSGYSAGVFGEAFNCANIRYINISSLPELSNTRTVSLWFNATSIDNNDRLFGSVEGSNYFNISFGASNNISAYTGGTLIEGGSLGINTWYNVVLVADGNIGRLYINGAEITSVSITSHTINPTSAYIGTNEGNVPAQIPNALIDQVRIFNTALTPLEVEALYTEELCICDGTVDTLDILGDGSCIATYQLDGNANDLSGNYSGTPTDVSYGVGEFDLSGVFNGSSSRITTVASQLPIPASGAFTVSFWAKVDSSLTQYNTAMMSFGDFWIKSEYLTGRFSLGDLNAGYETTSSMGYVWNHCVLTVDASNNINLYLNGANEFTGNKSISRTNGGNFAIGLARLSNPVYYFNGELDQVRIFSKALNSAEVTTLYNESACNYTPAYDPITEGETNPFGDGSEYALYKFDGNVTDSEGAYNGTAVGSVSYTTGLFGQAINLTGTNASVEVVNFSPSDFSNKNVSVSAWVNMQSLAAGQSSKGAHLFTVGGASWGIQIFAGGISMSKYLNGSNFINLIYPISVNLGQWYHIVCVDSVSQGLKIYVNGILVRSIYSTTTTIDTSLQDIGWGYYNNVFADRRGFFGYIDQARIFNKALTASEIYALYNE